MAQRSNEAAVVCRRCSFLVESCTDGESALEARKCMVHKIRFAAIRLILLVFSLASTVIATTIDDGQPLKETPTLTEPEYAEEDGPNPPTVHHLSATFRATAVVEARPTRISPAG